MDPMAAPGTMPPNLKRKRFDISMLPPEMQAQLASGQNVTFEDGSIVYPDGTSSGAGDSANDFDMPTGFDYGAGGFNASLGGGMPSGPHMMPDGTMMGGNETLEAPTTSPLDGPLFKRYRQTANAGFPGSPGGIGGGPAEGPDAMNPMGDAVGDANDEEPTPRLLTVEGPKVDYRTADDTRPQAPGTMPGRIGRRGSTPTRRPGSRPMTSRRRR